MSTSTRPGKIDPTTSSVTQFASNNDTKSTTEMDLDHKHPSATEELHQKHSVSAGDNISLPASIARNGNVDPDIAAIISQLSPDRRAAIEKRVKLKIDCFLFPMLLAFYILNYIVCRISYGSFFAVCLLTGRGCRIAMRWRTRSWWASTRI
jgi:hypothetical protein